MRIQDVFRKETSGEHCEGEQEIRILGRYQELLWGKWNIVPLVFGSKEHLETFE
jgi:hypothetical protein